MDVQNSEVCLALSLFINISIGTVSTVGNCLSLDYQSNPVCATCGSTVLSIQGSNVSSVVALDERSPFSTSYSYRDLSTRIQLTSAPEIPSLPDEANPTSSALVASLSSIIVLLVLTLLFITTIFVCVLVWKKKRRQCQTFRSKSISSFVTCFLVCLFLNIT